MTERGPHEFDDGVCYKAAVFPEGKPWECRITYSNYSRTITGMSTQDLLLSRAEAIKLMKILQQKYLLEALSGI